MDLSLTIKLNGVGETLVAPEAVQKRGKIIQVRSKATDAKAADCVLCSGSGQRNGEPCRKCNGEGHFPSEYLLRLSGTEGKDDEVFKKAREWATSRGLKVTTKLILKESVGSPRISVLANIDGGKFIPADRSGTVYAFRALLVSIAERPTADEAIGRIDLIEVRDTGSASLALFEFKTKGPLDPTKDVKILPDAIRTSKFFPQKAVEAALAGQGWSSVR